MTWAYQNEDKSVVWRKTAEGIESRLVSDPEVAVWLAAGGNPSHYAAPPVAPPQKVTARQARRALDAVGKLGLIAPAIDALPEPQRSHARIDWEWAADIERDSEFVVVLGPILGSPAEVDALFALAATF